MKTLTLLFGAITLKLLLCLTPLHAALPSQIPVIHIQTQGLTPLQTGLETGRQVKNLFPDVEQRYDAWLATLFKRSELEIIFRRQLPVLVSQLDEDSRAELQGISGAWSLSANNEVGDGRLSADEYYLLNLLPDLGLLPNGVGFGIYGKAAQDKNPVVGRNLDWANHAILNDLQLITVYENNQHSFVTIGFAGMVTLFSGFNDRGLFISLLNAEPYSPYSKTNQLKDTVPTGSFTWRTALMSNSTAAGATDYLIDKSYNFAHSVLLADKNLIQVLEHSPQQQKSRIRQWPSWLNAGETWNHSHQIAVVNCLLLAEMEDTCTAAINTVRWQRLNEFAETVEQQPPGDKHTVAQILFDQANRGYEIFNDNTLQSFYYLPASNQLYLYTKAHNNTDSSNILHQPYLNLLPSVKDRTLPLTWLIWPLLFLKIGTMFWLSHKHKNKKRTHKNTQPTSTRSIQ